MQEKRLINLQYLQKHTKKRVDLNTCTDRSKRRGPAKRNRMSKYWIMSVWWAGLDKQVFWGLLDLWYNAGHKNKPVDSTSIFHGRHGTYKAWRSPAEGQHENHHLQWSLASQACSEATNQEKRSTPCRVTVTGVTRKDASWHTIL